jgi:protein-disulfide isomerase
MAQLRNNRPLLIVAVVAIVAVVLIVVWQLLAVAPSSSSPFARFEAIPQERLADGGFVLGNPEAPITVIEFADFACPHCQEYSPAVHDLIDEFVATGKAKLEYRMFISAADPTYGPYTAKLAECASEQVDGGFFAAHDVLFEIGRARGRFNEQTAKTISDRLGLDYSALLGCAQDADQYEFDQNMGVNLGVQSTPTIMVRYGSGEPQFITIGSQTYNRGPVPYNVLQAVIAAAQ